MSVERRMHMRLDSYGRLLYHSRASLASSRPTNRIEFYPLGGSYQVGAYHVEFYTSTLGVLAILIYIHVGAYTCTAVCT